MPVTRTSGDPLLTNAAVLCFGHNARGRLALDPLETQLLQSHPAAFAAYRKRCRAGRIKPGDLWVWRESIPGLGFMVVRESIVGATRQRHVEAAALTLARDYALYGISSAAIAPLAGADEWADLLPVIEHFLNLSDLPCVIYEHYLPGMAGETSTSD